MKYVIASLLALLPIVSYAQTGTPNVLSLSIGGPTATQRILQWNTLTSPRWKLYANATAENPGTNGGSDLDLLAANDTGGAIGVLMRFTRATGVITVNPVSTAFPTTNFVVNGGIQNTATLYQTGQRTLTPGASMGGTNVNSMGFYQNITWKGTIDTGSGVPNFNTVIAHDQTNFARTLPATALLNLSDNYEAGASGDRLNLVVLHNQIAPAADGLDTGAINAAFFMHFDKGNSTDPANPLDRATSVNMDTRIGGTGNAVRVALVQENDLRVYAGNTVQAKQNIAIHNGVGDRVHGTRIDAALVIDSSGEIPYGTGGNTVLMQLGNPGSNFPIDPMLTNSAIMQVKAIQGGGSTFPWLATAAHGIDFNGLKFLNDSFRSTGWAIDGQGQQTIGPATVSYIAGGIKLSVPGFTEVSATIVSGGSNYYAGDQLWDPWGGLWNVDTVTLGSVASAISPIAGHKGFPPTANPTNVKLMGGSSDTDVAGNTATVNITTAPTGLLQLGDTGQTVSLFPAIILVANLPTTAPATHCALWVNANVVNRTVCP